MPTIKLLEARLLLPTNIQALDGLHADALTTCADGACSIHSVWGSTVDGEIYKANARQWMRDQLGQTVEDFRKKLNSPNMLAEVEMALWDLVAPAARQQAFASLQQDQEVQEESRRLWDNLCSRNPDVVRRCTSAVVAEQEAFTMLRQCKEQVISELGPLCVEAFRDDLIKPLLKALGVLEEYERQIGPKQAPVKSSCSKFELLFADTPQAKQMQRNLVE